MLLQAMHLEFLVQKLSIGVGELIGEIMIVWDKVHGTGLLDLKVEE